MKCALFAYNGELMCFVHVLLNALDMQEKGHEAGIVIEGSATGLVPELFQGDNPLFNLYQKVKEQDQFFGACKACSNQMGTIETVRSEGIALLDDMSGHPSIAKFQEQGYNVITF